MIRSNMLFSLCLVLALTGCVGSIAPLADSSATDDALLGTWRGCQGTKIVVTHLETAAGYSMRIIDRRARVSGTYRLFIQRIGGEEFADVFYAPRDVTVEEFTAVHGIALIRHDNNDVVFGPMNSDWWNAEHLKGSHLQIIQTGEYNTLILGLSSDLQTFIEAHAHDPGAFVRPADVDKEFPNYGRLKRHWSAEEAKGCGEDL